MELLIGIAAGVVGAIFGYCMGWYDHKAAKR